MSHLFSTYGYPWSVSNCSTCNEYVVLCAAVSWESQDLMIALHSCMQAKEFKAILQNQKHLPLCHSNPLSKIMMHNAKNITTCLWGVILMLISKSFKLKKKLEEFLTVCNEHLIFRYCWFILYTFCTYPVHNVLLYKHIHTECNQIHS